MRPFQSPNQAADGCEAILSMAAASWGRELRHASACRRALDMGSTMKQAPAKGLSPFFRAEVTDWQEEPPTPEAGMVFALGGKTQVAPARASSARLIVDSFMPTRVADRTAPGRLRQRCRLLGERRPGLDRRFGKDLGAALRRNAHTHVVALLAVQIDVQAFVFFLGAHSQTDDRVDELEQHERAHHRVADANAHGEQLLAKEGRVAG